MDGGCNLRQRKIYMRGLVFLLLIGPWIGINTGEAQIHYSVSFTEKLKENKLAFVEPVEGMFKVVLPHKGDLIPHDLKISSKEKNIELSYLIKPDLGVLVPHVDLWSTTGTLAINDDHFDLRMVTLNDELLREFNADWGAYVDFIPKISETKRNYGRLISIYRENHAMAYTIIYYDEFSPEIEFRMQSLSFIATEN